jgi:hypothetical protein
MSFVITQNFSLVGREVCLKCPVKGRALMRGPVVITKQIGPARYEARASNTLVPLLLYRDDFILPPLATKREPVWGEDDMAGFAYSPESGFYNQFRKF